MPVGGVMAAMTSVLTPVSAVTGLTITVADEPGPVVELHASAIVALFTCSWAACMVPVKIANASRENNRVDWWVLNFDRFIKDLPLGFLNGFLPQAAISRVA